MKAVILAAGKGTRMGNLSHSTPKPLLKVLGKTLLQHKLESLPSEITEVIIVVGYLKELIIEAIGMEHSGKKITYIIQDELYGTGHSLFLCKDQLRHETRFLVMMGDDIYSNAEMQTCLKTPWSVLVFDHHSVKGRAEVILGENGLINRIQEKSPKEGRGLVCAGMYSLTPQIFEYPLVAISEKEFGLPQTIVSAGKHFDIQPILSNSWIQITEPADLLLAEKLIQSNV